MPSPPLFAHQAKSLAFLSSLPQALDFSDPGCVSADTQFLTPTGWKRIDKYVKGDAVGQFHPETREVEFVCPIAYVKRPCQTMIAIAPCRGMSQRISHEHRILYYNEDGTHDVCSAAEYMHALHERGPNRLKRKFAVTFSMRTTTSLPLTDADIRVMVAVVADGHFGGGSNRCTIRVKKPRKRERLRALLSAANLEYAERTCGGQPDFQVFRFTPPRQDKIFGEFWWQASQAQLEVIADEVQHWDSAQDSRPSAGTRFSSFELDSAEFIQYAFAAAKRPATLTDSTRDRRREGRGVMVEFTVHARRHDTFVGPGRAQNVFEVPNPEGFKYCFEVPTGFLLLRHNGYIFATGNTGKTAVHILDFLARRKRGGKCALVLAPKTLLRNAWQQDIQRFAPTLRTSIAFAANREAAFNQDADIYVTNIDAAKWLAKQPASFFSKFDTLIIDESSAYKHHASQRSKAIAKICRFFLFRRALSGTPAANSITDLWHQVRLIDDGKRLGKSFFSFRASVCAPQQIGPRPEHVKWVDRPGADAAVYGLLKDLVIRHKFEECIDIPANHQYARYFEMNTKHRKRYETMEEDALLEIGKQTVSAVNAAALVTKCLQAASGAVYDDGGGYVVLDDERYKLVLDLVEERKNCVVFFLWQHQRNELLKEAEKRGITYCVLDGSTSDSDRSQLVTHYQAGLYRVMFAHPQSAAHGLTLTRGTTTIWCSPTYNLEHFLQGNRRIYRAGQTGKTETIVILTAGTVEERAYTRLQAKGVAQGNLLDLLQTPIRRAA